MAAQQRGPEAELLTPTERSALEGLSSRHGTAYSLIDSWFAGQPIQYYDFGATDPQPGTLYRVGGGGEVVTSLPGMPGYSAIRQVLDVHILPSAGVAPEQVRSHLTIQALLQQGRARLTSAGMSVNVPIVPDGSTLERDVAGRRLRTAFFKGRPVPYFDFGASRATAIPLITFAVRFPQPGQAPELVPGQATNASAVPGSDTYSDLWNVQVAVGSGYKPGSYRDFRRVQTDSRAGRILVRPLKMVFNGPVMYVDGRPARRPGPALPATVIIASQGPTLGVDSTGPGTDRHGTPGTESARPANTAAPSSVIQGAAEDAASSASLSYDGSAGRTSLAPPRVDTAVLIDGILDEPVWSRAPRLTGFSQFRPIEGRPAEDSTEARIWYSPTAIHIGIRAFAPPNTIGATLADRDKIDRDDYVQILLDTFNDRRQALAFGVNAFGVQADGIKSEGGGQARTPGGGQGQGPGGQQGNTEGFDRGLDLSPDFVWQSKGRLTEWGYEVEIRIPFKSLRYQSGRTQDWGTNILRKVQRSAYEDTWTRTARSASFLGQSGSLQGLHDLQRGLVLDLNPFTLGRLDGAPATPPSVNWQYDSRPEAGANLRWGATTNLTVAATVNPDFSQVEADAAQAPPDPRFAQFFAEKRPFFVEGTEQFSSPAQLIYTRRIADPLGALKLTGKAGATAIGVLSSVDSKAASSDGTENPIYNLVRLRRDVGRASTAGLTYTDKVDGSNYNRVAVADARFVFARFYSLQLQAGGSQTRTGTSTTRDVLWDAWSDRAGRTYGFMYRIQGFGPDFQAQSGFVRRTGIVQVNVANRFSIIGRRGAALETWTNRLTFNGTWNYDDFFSRRGPAESRFGWSSQFSLRGGWSVSLNPLFEIFRFDPVFHAGYYVEQTLPGGARDTVPFSISQHRRNYDLISRLDSPQFRWGSASLSLTWSPHDLDLFEFASANLVSLVATVDLKPTDKVRVNAQYTRRYLTRLRDGTRVTTTDIPRLKVEYQMARPLLFRLVGQYDGRTSDAFRDPRTEVPILIRSGSGASVRYAPSARLVTTDIRVDALLSYQPNPGTVLFAGYGSSLTEADPFAFRDLRRVRDGFFVKLSYLFRM